jgi:hypothetical protein
MLPTDGVVAVLVVMSVDASNVTLTVGPCA